MIPIELPGESGARGININQPQGALLSQNVYKILLCLQNTAALHSHADQAESYLQGVGPARGFSRSMHRANAQRAEWVQSCRVPDFLCVCLMVKAVMPYVSVSFISLVSPSRSSRPGPLKEPWPTSDPEVTVTKVACTNSLSSSP